MSRGESEPPEKVRLYSGFGTKAHLTDVALHLNRTAPILAALEAILIPFIITRTLLEKLW